MSAITHLYAGVPVSDLDASIDRYTRFFGRPPDRRVGQEILWESTSTPVAELDALLERLAAEGVEHEPVETYSNGVRHVKVPDPDGNAIAFAEPPD